ncbi:hypothetical protein DR950_18335 [Kitasatospora xanthocidica]|uniref:Uncharacterized protein n=1 Tax=Kitasatospora xanthocidica TaxID=83382 RepID=A0A372ZUQ3_9ACTN|nr:hypothetical protein [Kitasatospora xanthocidica]RGD59491.1 hypothetical protein DR950_18335 [Kitasatospora xanthocidica]
MQRGDAEYAAALEAMEGILLDWVTRPFRPLYYSDLSSMLVGDGHPVPAHDGPMPYLLEDCTRLHGGKEAPMLSAVVVRKGKERPSAGFFKLARAVPFLRRGADEPLWLAELAWLERTYVDV